MNNAINVNDIRYEYSNVQVTDKQVNIDDIIWYLEEGLEYLEYGAFKTVVIDISHAIKLLKALKEKEDVK